MYSSYADGGEHRYVGCNGKEYRGDEPWKSIERSLSRSELVAGWQKGYDGRIRSELDFYVVSVNPSIVIACTSDRGSTFPRMDSKAFDRPIVIGTQISCSNPDRWLPVPGASLRPLDTVSESERKLEYEGTVITLRRSAGKWLTERSGQ